MSGAPNKSLKIGIVGAGIGGLACAIALRKSNHEVQIFERARELKEVGAGLTLWANGTVALERLGVLYECVENGKTLETLNVQRKDARLLMTIPLQSFATPALGVHRADLHTALRAPVNTMIQLGFNCEEMWEDSTGAYIKSNTETAGPFDLVLGADGLRSQVRERILGPAQPHYHGYRIWRGIAHDSEALSPNGEFFETWGRGMRFGHFPIGGGKICWYATANGPEDKSRTPPRDSKTFLSEAFEGWCRPLAQFIQNTSEILCTNAYDRAPQRGWSRGRFLLIGDAAHPTVPNLGLGACMALEDAVVLGKIFNATSSIENGLAAFEKERFKRTASIMRRSQRIGRIGQWAGATTMIRDEICALIPGTLFTRTSRAIHAYTGLDAA